MIILERVKYSIFGSKKSALCNVTASNSLSRKSGPVAITSFKKNSEKTATEDQGHSVVCDILHSHKLRYLGITDD